LIFLGFLLRLMLIRVLEDVEHLSPVSSSMALESAALPAGLSTVDCCRTDSLA
jgi:hypothetical protein